MDLDGIRTNLAAWSTYAEKPSKSEKSKDVFLKVHDGKLTYESREALPTGIKWLKTRGEYNFSKNIEQLKTVLTTARENIGSLGPVERKKLQELHKLYDNLVARYQEKATPGVIGRLFIFLGVKDYKAEIQKAVNAQKLPFQIDDWTKPHSLTKIGIPPPVEVRSDLMRQAAISKSVIDVVGSSMPELGKAEALPATPKTPTEIGQAAVRGILMGSIDAFSKAAASRQAELFYKDPSAADQIGELLKELVKFRTGISSSNAGEKLEEFHRKFEATKLPEVSTPEEREARAQLKKEKAEAEAPMAELDMAEFDGISGANQPHFQEISNLPLPVDIEESDEAVLQVKSAPKLEAPKTFSEVYDEIQVLSKKADLLEALRKGRELPPHEDLSLLKKDVEKLKKDLESHNGGEFPVEFLERLQIADALLYSIQLDTYK